MTGAGLLLFGLSFVFFSVGSVMMVLSLLGWRRLMRHLKDHHNDRWVYLTSVDSFLGPGMNNPIRAFRYLFDDDDMDDSLVRDCKHRLRKLTTFTIVRNGAAVASLLISFLLLFWHS